MVKFNKQKTRKTIKKHIIYGHHSVTAALLNKKREHKELILTENQRNFAKNFGNTVKKVVIIDNKDFKQRFGDEYNTQGVVLISSDFSRPSLNEFIKNEKKET